MDAERRRYFVALLPPGETRDEAEALKQAFADRFGSRAALRSPPHITLLPPFLWPDDELPALEAGLRAFAAPRAPVPVTLAGFGAFPPRVIFLVVEKTPELLALQAELALYVEDAFELPRETRPFSPHLTLAYRDLSRGSFRAAWPEFRDRPFRRQFDVPELTLLRHDGRRWQVGQEFAFQNG